MGQEPDDPVGSVPRRARRPHASHPGGSDGPDLRRVRASQARDGPAGLRGHARPRPAALRRTPRGRPGRPITVLRVHRGRVPGREPAPSGAARSVARPARRPLRRGRRLPDDLRVHRRLSRASARLHPAIPARHGGPSRGELPLHAGSARPRESSRVSAGRVREDPPFDEALGPVPDRASRAERGGRGLRRRRRRPATASRGGRAPRGDRGALPDQRPLGAVRGGLRRRRDPVSGARRCVPAATRAAWGPAAAEANERGRPRGRRRRGHHRAARLRPRRVARRRRGGHAPVRPRAHALPGVGVRARASGRRTSRPSWPSSPTGSPPSTTAAA